MFSIPTFHRVALLIDADNTQLNHLEQILKISRYYGNLKICRAYGDWKKQPLSISYKRVRGLNIKTIQVDRVAKQTTDKRLLSEAREILRADNADLFVIVSGDGDFRQLCEQIKQKGRKVVGIGNEGHSSTHLRASCDTFYYIEHLVEDLIQLEQTRLQEFKALLLRALCSIPCDREGQVNFGPLGNKLRELDLGFENRFGGKKLSEWLSDLSSYLDISGQMVRVIDPEFLSV
jgi:uncharacterized protein (TIGR00288 family)